MDVVIYAEYQKYYQKKIVYTILFWTLFVFFILFGTNTINSGFHLVDDHEHFSMYYRKLQGISMVNTIMEYVKNDATIRFRPLYYPFKVFFSYITNGNIKTLSILKGIEVIWDFEIIYLVLRKLKCSKFYSAIGTCMVLMGSISAVWWKLGPQE